MSGPRLEFGLSCPPFKEVADSLRGVRARGFASMPEGTQRAIASQGGKAAHAAGRAHQYSREEAKQHGKTGGSKATKEHLKAIGRKGGLARARKYGQQSETVIHFEDLGQDFLRFVVRGSEVVGSEPFQGWLWVGAKVLSKPRVGRCLDIEVQSTLKHVKLTLRYRITKIEYRQVSDKPAVQS